MEQWKKRKEITRKGRDSVPGDEKPELGVRDGLDFCKMEIVLCFCSQVCRRRRQARSQAGRYPGNLSTIAFLSHCPLVPVALHQARVACREPGVRPIVPGSCRLSSLFPLLAIEGGP